MNTPLGRRDMLLAAAGAIAMPGRAFAAKVTAGGLRFTGNAVQGGLVIGRVGPGNEVWVDGAPVRVQDGVFCFGFGRDAVKPAIVRVRYPKDYEETREVAPKKRNFRIQRIDGLPEKYVSPPKDILDRIARDAKVVAEARSQDLDEDWFLQEFAWPADGPISSIYGSQRILNGEPRAPHYGLDIAAPEGSPVVAPAAGIVRLVEPDFFLTGGTIILDHGFGVQSVFIHMNAVVAKLGKHVEQGEVIGYVGHKGRATGPHLHWGMNWLDVRLDPAYWVPKGGNLAAQN
jgi:murein DD-endopeptidase MepM/ murein hydrolase activator NlpD